MRMSLRVFVVALMENDGPWREIAKANGRRVVMMGMVLIVGLRHDNDSHKANNLTTIYRVVLLLNNNLSALTEEEE